MRITWYGHAAFRLEAAGVAIIIDPYRSPDSGGYLPIGDPADVVVVSHENDRYHSHLGQIIPPFALVRGLDIPTGGQIAAGIRFESFRVFETPERLPGDEVSVVYFTWDGIRVVFLGDLGHDLTEAEAQLIRGADVALVPAGGPPTIDLSRVATLIAAIAPRWIVPMHYLTPRINLKIQPVERFLEALPDWTVVSVAGPTVEVDATALDQGPRIVWLQSAR